MKKRALFTIAAAFSLTGALAGGIILPDAPAASAASAPRHSVSRPHKPKHHVRPKKHHTSPKKHHTKPKKHHTHLKHRTRPKRPTPRQLARQGRWKLGIPGIGVTSRLLALGDPHGPVLSVPALSQASEAAWYTFSAVPGTPGNAVLVGHVDTYTGPAVFYDLYRLRRGTPIYVTIGGRRLRFAVRGVTEVRKGLFPVNRIFGASTSRHLWIITCGGAFDYTTRHYMDNIIVSASYQPVHRKQRH